MVVFHLTYIPKFFILYKTVVSTKQANSFSLIATASLQQLSSLAKGCLFQIRVGLVGS